MSQLPIIAVTAAKGGTGKSTLTANLAACLARVGMRPLCLDLDAQGSLTRFLANTNTVETMTRLATLNDREAMLREAEHLCSFSMPEERSVVALIEGKKVDPIVAHGVGLVGFSDKANNRLNDLGTQRNQAKFIEGLQATIEAYQPTIVFIDTPPSNQDAAAFAINNLASHLVLPLEPSEEGVRGVLIAEEQRQAVLRIRQQQGWKKDLVVAGVVPCAVSNCNIARISLNIARAVFGKLVTSSIDHAVRIKEANTEGLPIIIYEEKLKGIKPKYQVGGASFHKSGRQMMQVAYEIGVNLGLFPAAPEPIDSSQDVDQSTASTAQAQ